MEKTDISRLDSRRAGRRTRRRPESRASHLAAGRTAVIRSTWLRSGIQVTIIA